MYIIIIGLTNLLWSWLKLFANRFCAHNHNLRGGFNHFAHTITLILFSLHDQKLSQHVLPILYIIVTLYSTIAVDLKGGEEKVGGSRQHT